MRIAKFLAIGAVLLSTTTPSAAEDMTSGNALLQSCLNFINQVPASQFNTLEIQKEGICIGAATATVVVSPKICQPKGVTNGQAVRVVIAYMQQHPERLHEHIAQLAEEAASNAWPCPKPNR
jgi:hypothetical protein